MRYNIMHNFKKNECCGCGNCVNSCPTNALFYTKDDNGFIVPSIDKSKCVNCSLCEKVCPYHSSLKKNLPLKCYAAVNKKDDILIKSSSGGVFYELAKYIIDNDGYVYGAAFDENYKVKHICVHDLKELNRIMKSKYVQSFLGEVFKDVKTKLNEGKTILFSGTPCQIAALKSFLTKEYERLFFVSVVCHGVPSQQLFDDYLSFMNRKGEINDFSFRSKKRAKNGMNAFISYKRGNKQTIKNWLEDSYHYFFMYSYSGRDSCYGCKFIGNHQLSDITLCDYWGWQNHHRDIFAKNDSVSGIVINTTRGQQLFDNIKNEFILCDSKFEWISEYNKSINFPNSANAERDRFFETYNLHGYEKLDSFYRRKTFAKRMKYRFRGIIRKMIGRC